MFRKSFLAAALLFVAPALYAQSTVTLTPSVTAGDGQLSTSISWSTNPPLSTGTPCVATSTPNHAGWTGNKAGSGSTPAPLLFTVNTRLTLSCTFPGDSIVTFSWTPATTNSDGTNYVNRNFTRIRHTFNATLPTSPLPACNTGGVTCVDVPDDTTPRQTMRTVTGITATGTMRAIATHVNSVNAESAPSNAVMKTFTGNVVVNQAVDLTIRSVPNGPGAFTAE